MKTLADFPIEEVRRVRDTVVLFLSKMPPEITAIQLLTAIAYEEAQLERDALSKDQIQ